MNRWILQLFVMVFLISFLSADPVLGYPIDGYEATGIRRLAWMQQIVEGRMAGPVPEPGAWRSTGEIKLNLLDSSGSSMDVLPPADPKLQEGINALFPDRDASYALALLDITPGKPIRLVMRQADREFSPGSVGKLAIAAGLFRELKVLYPDSVDDRQKLLRTRMIEAGRWIHTDHHNVPIFNPDNKTFASRQIREGDLFSLYEWVDHMLSASANAAASTVWKELLLMRHFGKHYPPSFEKEKEFFQKTSPTVLRDMAMSTVNDPLRECGIAQKEWQLGSFFTAAGKKIVPGGGKSAGTPLGLLKFLVAMERGRIIDPWSSLELKRLMYITARRIRYASSPALKHAALYFKSGSLYRCKPEPGFKCGKYMGNVENYMNSVAIIEHRDGRTYLVALMSNVLRKNSALEHQSIATHIDRILEK